MQRYKMLPQISYTKIVHCKSDEDQKGSCSLISARGRKCGGLIKTDQTFSKNTTGIESLRCQTLERPTSHILDAGRMTIAQTSCSLHNGFHLMSKALQPTDVFSIHVWLQSVLLYIVVVQSMTTVIFLIYTNTEYHENTTQHILFLLNGGL